MRQRMHFSSTETKTLLRLAVDPSAGVPGKNQLNLAGQQQTVFAASMVDVKKYCTVESFSTIANIVIP